MNRCLALLPLAALAACVRTPAFDTPVPPPAPQPRFDAIAFFTGATEGRGRLAKVFSSDEITLVQGQGTVEGGVLRLVQQVREGSKPPRTREWRIREDRPDHYVGTLSDAVGPVTGETIGNRLHLSFTMKGGLATEQWLTLSPDGQRAANILTVRKFGITVAVLSEDIRRVP